MPVSVFCEVIHWLRLASDCWEGPLNNQRFYLYIFSSFLSFLQISDFVFMYMYLVFLKMMFCCDKLWFPVFLCGLCIQNWYRCPFEFLFSSSLSLPFAFLFNLYLQHFIRTIRPDCFSVCSSTFPISALDLWNFCFDLSLHLCFVLAYYCIVFMLYIRCYK